VQITGEKRNLQNLPTGFFIDVQGELQAGGELCGWVAYYRTNSLENRHNSEKSFTQRI
jgi:hypothetical protein